MFLFFTNASILVASSKGFCFNLRTVIADMICKTKKRRKERMIKNEATVYLYIIEKSAIMHKQ
jgi:hypothetical protein